MQGSGAFLCLWEGERGASAHSEAGSGEPVGQDSLGVLAAHGQQLVHREGGGAEDGLEGDGVDALSPQLTQGGQRGPEGGREPSDADGEGIAALGARVGDALAVLVGDSQAGEGKGGCGRGGRAAAGRGRRLLGDNRSFRLHRAGDRDLIDDLAVGIGGGDFCARAQLVLDGVEVELPAVLREGPAVALGSLASLGGQLEAARQIDAAAVDAVAAVAVFAVAAVGSNRTAGDGDVEAADAVAAAAAVVAVGSDRTAGDGEAAVAGDMDAAAAGAALGRQAVIFAAGDGEAAAAVDAAAVDVALQRVVAIQLDIGVALAGHAYGGFVPAAGVDVHILERDLDLIVLIFGLDGHGVGRSFVLTICDDGVGVFHLLIRPL